MRWVFGKLIGAVVAGVGWKLGADAYEAVKKHLKERTAREGDAATDDGAGVTQTHVVDVSDEQPHRGGEGALT